MADHVDNANLPTINRAATIIGVATSFLGVALFAVTFRLCIRIRDRLLGWDDLFVLLAAICTTVGSTLTCFMPETGLGLHLWTLNESLLMGYYKSVWATNITYSSSTTFIKLAILFQYLRLFDFRSRGARHVTWTMIAVVSLWGVIFFSLALFSCRPIEKNWNWKMPGKCVGWGTKDPGTFFPSWATHSASNMFIDILILVLPIPFLRALRIQGRERLALIGLFVVGTIVTSMSICRMIALSITRAGTVPILDMTYHTPAVYLFSILEVNLAIMLASIPIFWPVVLSLAISLASNKILVVNEIEVRTEIRDSRAIGYDEQGSGPSFELQAELDKGGRSSRVSTLDMLKEEKEPSRLQKTLRLHKSPYSHKSNSSSRQTPPLSITPTNRMSSESQQNLAHQPSSAALSSCSTSPQEHLGLDPSRNTSITHYQDRYVQDWVVPGFDADGAPVGASHDGRPDRSTGNRTVVERAEVPFDHIRNIEK